MGFHEAVQERLLLHILHGIAMHGREQLAPAVNDGLDRTDVLARSDLIDCHHIGRHGADQHHHALRLRTAVEHIGADADIILRNAEIAACDLAPFIDHTDGQPRIRRLPVRNLADDIAQHRRFAAAGCGDNQGVQETAVFPKVRHHSVRAALFLMSNPHVDAGYMADAFHLFPFDYRLSGNADPVAALHGQKTLPQFILVGVEGKTSYVIHRIADIRR